MLELSKKDPGNAFDRAKLEDLLKQRFFYDMSFSIYGGMLWVLLCFGIYVVYFILELYFDFRIL